MAVTEAKINGKEKYNKLLVLYFLICQSIKYNFFMFIKLFQQTIFTATKTHRLLTITILPVISTNIFSNKHHDIL